MKKTLISNGLLLVGVILYNLLFWQEKLGLNILIFSSFILGGLYALNHENGLSKTATITMAGTMLTAVMVVFHNSLLSKIVHISSLIATIGFVQQRELRFFWYGLGLALYSLLEVPLKWKRQFGTLGLSLRGWGSLGRYIKLGLFPIVIVIGFYGLYAAGNPTFAKLSGDFWSAVFTFLFGWIEAISPYRIFFMLISIYLLSSVFWKPTSEWFQQREIAHQFILQRKRRPMTWKISMISLKNEYQVATILVWSLNVLLLFVNGVDINYVWFNVGEMSAADLSVFVHAGTYLLIFAIFSAMFILLYFFRGNLNFYRKNQALKYAAYVWIIQNMILAFSVGMRNYHYVHHYGLAYKRLGVFIFLLLTLFGLVTFYQKIRKLKTPYFLLWINSWILYGVMVGLTCINWDIAITQYNLTHTIHSGIDTNFLLRDVSDKNLYLLYEYKDSLQAKRRAEILDYEVNRKKSSFLNKQKKYGWASWNYADYRNLQYLKKRQD